MTSTHTRARVHVQQQQQATFTRERELLKRQMSRRLSTSQREKARVPRCSRPRKEAREMCPYNGRIARARVIINQRTYFWIARRRGSESFFLRALAVLGSVTRKRSNECWCLDSRVIREKNLSTPAHSAESFFGRISISGPRHREFWLIFFKRGEEGFS